MYAHTLHFILPFHLRIYVRIHTYTLTPYTHTCTYINLYAFLQPTSPTSTKPQRPCDTDMGWPWFVGFLKLLISFAKEPYKRDDIPQKRPTILRSLLIEATPYQTPRHCTHHTHTHTHPNMWVHAYIYIHIYTHVHTHAHTYTHTFLPPTSPTSPSRRGPATLASYSL